MEEGALHAFDGFAVVVIIKTGGEQTKHAGEFIDRAVSFETGAGLADATAADERGLAAITGAGIDV